MQTFSFAVYLFLLFTQIRKDLFGVHARHITMEHGGGQPDSQSLRAVTDRGEQLIPIASRRAVSRKGHPFRRRCRILAIRRTLIRTPAQMKSAFNETLMAVWRQALVDEADVVKLGSE